MGARLKRRTFTLGPADVRDFDAVRTARPDYRGVPVETAPPGTEVCLALRSGEPVARCSLSLAGGLQGAPGLSGLIGHFEASDVEAANAVLVSARETLAGRGAARVLVPVNGSTWGRYRVALPSDVPAGAAEPAWFLGEPANPPEYAAWIEAAGFRVAERYESRVDESPGRPASDAPELARAVQESGIRVRMFDPARFDDELRLLHTLSLGSFAGNRFYTPLAWREFRSQYESLRALVRPELVLIAEDARGRPLAFQFAYLDPLGAGLGAPPRAIVKTVATLPEARGRGLAGHMLDRLREHAVALGAAHVIHALMHVENFSMRMSSRHASRVFRRYALHEWRP